jgi:hypothetical protein
MQAIRTQLEQFNWDKGHYPVGATLAQFLDGSDTDYAAYWPETSTASATCPQNKTAYTWSTASNAANITCPNHSNL